MKRAESERLVAVEQRLVDHETRCEERLAEIRASSASTLKAVEGLKNRVWAIVLSLLCWAMAQLWAANQSRISRLERDRSAVLSGIEPASRASASPSNFLSATEE